jgi:putative peptidoglycan lipid II flippase
VFPGVGTRYRKPTESGNCGRSLPRSHLMVRTAFRLSAISAVITVFSFACQLLTARTFGAGHRFDVYLFAISIPFVVTGAAAGSLSQAFVPRLLSVRHDQRIYQDSVAALLVIAVMAASFIAFAGLSVTTWITSASANVFNGADRSAVISIARVAWLSAGLAMLASALTAVHHAEKSFLLPAISGTYLYAGMIAAMVGFRSPQNPIILAWGMLAGSLLSVVLLMSRVLRCITFHSLAKPRFHSLFQGVGRVALVIIANCAFSGLAPVEAFLAPRFGPGALSYLGYSQRLIIAMGAVVVVGPCVLLVPAVAEACEAKDMERVDALALRTIFAVTLIATLAALIFGILRVPVIGLLLQRGAFNEATTRGVADSLPWMLVGSIAMFGTQIAFRVLYGQNMHVFPATVGFMVPGLYLIVGLLLSYPFGFQGICIAYAVSWWLAFLTLLVKIFGISSQRKLTGAPLWGTLAALLVTAVTVLAGQRLLLPSQPTGATVWIALRCIAVAGLGVASFGITGALLWPLSNVRRFLPGRRHLARSK